MATGVAARCLRDVRCRQCTGKRLSRAIWSSFNKERMSHLRDSTVAGPTARRDNVLASKCEYPPFRYPPFKCALKLQVQDLGGPKGLLPLAHQNRAVTECFGKSEIHGPKLSGRHRGIASLVFSHRGSASQRISAARTRIARIFASHCIAFSAFSTHHRSHRIAARIARYGPLRAETFL